MRLYLDSAPIIYVVEQVTTSVPGSEIRRDTVCASRQEFSA
ncbi:MAG: hypothetical protein R3F11_32640 [Verrucomicrobiales bacterium]